MIKTVWGYAVEADHLPPLMTAAEFAEFTGGAFSSTTEKVDSVLDAVSASIRDYCGWHVSPNLPCIYQGETDGRLMVLPAMGVSSVESLTYGETEFPFEYLSSGVVRLKCGRFPDVWGGVKCEFHAGFDSAALAGIVGQIASNALAASPGVSDERAGNVSISYNRTGDGITGGISILERDRELLAPYKLVRAW